MFAANRSNSAGSNSTDLDLHRLMTALTPWWSFRDPLEAVGVYKGLRLDLEAIPARREHNFYRLLVVAELAEAQAFLGNLPALDVSKKHITDQANRSTSSFVFTLRALARLACIYQHLGKRTVSEEVKQLALQFSKRFHKEMKRDSLNFREALSNKEIKQVGSGEDDKSDPAKELDQLYLRWASVASTARGGGGVGAFAQPSQSILLFLSQLEEIFLKMHESLGLFSLACPDCLTNVPSELLGSQYFGNRFDTLLNAGQGPRKITARSVFLGDLSEAQLTRLEVPSLASFGTVVAGSRFGDLGPGIMNALLHFQDRLDRAYTVAELRDLSELYRKVALPLPRDNYRFVFDPARTADGGIVLTVFLEALPEEISQRPTNYENCNKQVHNAFFSANGMVKKDSSAYRRDARMSLRLESSAYAKFYITTWGGSPKKGLSVLIHPTQNARLGYVPDRDATYKQLKEDLNNFIRKLAQYAGYLRFRKVNVLEELFRRSIPFDPNSGKAGHNRQAAKDSLTKEQEEIVLAHAKVLNIIAEHLRIVSDAAYKISFADVALEQVRLIRKLLNSVPYLKRLDYPAEGSDQPKRNLRRKITVMIGRVLHARDIYIKARGQASDPEAESSREVPYAIADKLSGPTRERLFLAVSDILKQCLEESCAVPAYRFMLASEQIRTIRLTNPRGRIRERIMAVPLALEQSYPVVETSYPLLTVDGNRVVSQHTSPILIKTISIDGAAVEGDTDP